jgi:hypothetical protein
MKPGYGHPNEKFGELLSFAVEVFGQALDNHAKAVDFQIDGDIVVDEKHYRKGEHP